MMKGRGSMTKRISVGDGAEDEDDRVCTAMLVIVFGG